MAQQFTLANSTNASDRLLNAGKASLQLSDGTLVFLYYDGTNMILAYSSDHATVNTIATFAAGWQLNGNAGGLKVVPDSSDNLFVVGVASSPGGAARVQAYTKGVGYTWTQQTALNGAASIGGSSSNDVGDAVWCNTGGGTNSKGHILAVVQRTVTTASQGYYICDAGAALAGTGTLVTNQALGVTFLGNGNTGGSLAGALLLSLSPDGFGAANGIAVAAQSGTTGIGVGSWAVNSSGALSTNTSITGASPLTTGSMSASKTRVVRGSSNRWGIVVPSTTAGRYMVAVYSATAQITALTDSGAPTSMPLNSAALSWDAFADPVTANKLWVIATAAVSGGNQQVYRLGCLIGSGVTWDAAVTADDLLTTVNTSGADVRAVSQPTGTKVDWQVFVKATGTNWALYGDYTLLASAPNADTLSSPANGSFQDASGGLVFQSVYNSTDAANANAYALRAKQSGGAYVYWNATTGLWQGTIVWNALSTAPGATRTVTVPASATIANGATLNWSMASQEALASLQGSFASDFSIVMQVAPTLTVTGPSGTSTTSTPTVTWTTTPGAGLAQTSYRVVAYNAAQYGAGGFSPGVSAGDYDSGVIGGAVQQLTIPAGYLTAGLTYRYYVIVTETGGESSTWQFASSTITLDPPADPTITATPGTDGTTGAPRTVVVVQGRDNFLSASAASFEDGTTGGWVAGASTAIANSTAQALNGTHSLSLTRQTTTGIASAGTPTGVSGAPCQPGQQVTEIVNFRAAATPRSCSFTINWWQASGIASAVRASDTSASVNDTTSGWTAATLTVVAPSDAATFSITANVAAAVANEVHYIDEIDAGPGSSTVWTRGGLSGLTSAVVQFSDDAGVTWTNMRTSGATIPWPSQTVTLYDYEAPPGAVRRYRAQVQANVGATIASGVVTTTATGTTPSQWVISDPTDTTSGLLFHASADPTRALAERATLHAPFSRARQVKVSDGTKGWGGRLQVRSLSTAQQIALESLLARNVPLLLQSPEGGGRQWYANVSTDPTVSQNAHTLGATVLSGVAGRGTTKMPHSDVALAYVEAERP